MTRFLTFSAAITLLLIHGNEATAVTEQKASYVFEGRSYLYVEAENYSSLNDTGNEGDGFIEVSKDNPVVSTQGLDILPADSNVSGTALLDFPGGQYSHADSATWEVKFMTAGTYQLVPRITLFEEEGNGNYGNEDSIFLPPAFNLNSSTDWVGFEGKEHYDDQNPDIDIPITGFALDPDGWITTEVGDSIHDGRIDIGNWGIKNNGVLEENPNDFRDGHFAWIEKPMMAHYDSGNTWIGSYGFRTTYEVTPEQVGEVLTFEIGTRETYSGLDGFMFIEDPDTDLLDLYSQADLDALIPDPNPPMDLEDLNGDGSVDGLDLGILLGNFGSSSDAAGGELNGTDPVDGLDLGILLGAWNPASLQAATAVPEPTAAMLLMSACCLLGLRRRA